MPEHPPRSRWPSGPAPDPPRDPPTDPGTGGIYGPVPAGWGNDHSPDREHRLRRRRRAGIVMMLASLALAVLALLLWLLIRSVDDAPGVPAGSPRPEPTLALERGGFRYSIGVGPFTPTVAAPGSGAIPPGRQVLTATVVVRNDTDRPAPSLIDSDGAAPRLRVGLGGVDALPPATSLGLPRLVSDCLNDPRNPRVFTTPEPDYRGLAAGTCIVAATTRPAVPAPTGVSDRTLAPGGINDGVVTTIELPESVPTDQVSVWLADTTTPGGATVFVRIP